MSGADVPVIDLAPLRAGGRTGRDAVARLIDRACKGTGFFCVTGHGVDERLIARTRAAGEAFFALPEARKRAIERDPESSSRGYYPFADRSLAYMLGEAAPPDLQEAWAMGPIDLPAGGVPQNDITRRFFAANLWPEGVPGFRETLSEYYRAIVPLAEDIMSGCAIALGKPEDFFAGKCDRAASVVRLIRYPAQSAAPTPGQLRAGAHTDYGTVTILRGDDVPGGTQIALPSGDWIDVRRPADGFVCNIGDFLAEWSGGRWNSTLHRVGNPPPGTPPADRISIVFFHQPNHDVRIDGRGPTYAEHNLAKLRKAKRQQLDAESTGA